MPRFRLTPSLCAVAMIATVASSVGAQNPVELGKRSGKSKYTLGSVTGIVELPDGRVVAADRREPAFRLVDFAKGEVGLIGKQGEGPDDYRSAFAVYPHAGDSVMLYDAAGRKFLRVAPNGTLAGSVPFPAALRRGPNAADASGALYYTVSEFDTVAKAMKPLASLRRWPAGATSDQEVSVITTRRADQIAMKGLVPFVYRDLWAVRGDGLVARVVSDTYQVIWLRDGKEAGRTGPLPYQPIPITPAEQQAIRDSIAQQFKTMTAGGGPGGPGTFVLGPAGGGRGDVAFAGGGVRTVMIGGAAGASGAPVVISGGDRVAVEGGARGAAGGPPGGPPPGPMTAADSQRMKDAIANMAKMADIPAENFPATKPAVPSGGNAAAMAMFDMNGMLWVPRERVRGDAVPKYDIVAEGKGIVAQVKLPAGTRLLGFGKGVVYLGRTEDGSDWLERYAMPKVQ
jgi:hypothetical protein